MQPTILTSTGRTFNFLHPEQCEFVIEDIAHALSNICRFTGHPREFYSVAQHAFYVSTIVPPQHARAALLHDGTEAYLSDMSSPLKALMPAYKELEHKVERLLLSSFGLPPDLHPCIKQADLEMLATEKRDLMPPNAMDWTILDGIRPRQDLCITPWPPGMAKAFFLKRYQELTS